MSHGGARPGAGRKVGVPNKVAREIAEAAKEYSEAALSVLADVMMTGDSAAARVAAANSILDRAHGKPRQSVEVDANVKAMITEVRRTIVDPRNSDA